MDRHQGRRPRVEERRAQEGERPEVAQLGEVLLLRDVREADQVAEQHERAAGDGGADPAADGERRRHVHEHAAEPMTTGLSGFALCQAS